MTSAAQAAYNALEEARKAIKENDLERADDLICDVLDQLTGWCGSEYQLDAKNKQTGT